MLEGGRNLGMFFASGPFPLRAGQTERFSMALIFADKDFTDPRQIDNSSLARKKQTVQQIYNANYQFARPPDKPTLRATPGDGQVTLSWDDRAEQSYDPFLREFDFEGYMIYRSTEPNFRENLLVTDAYGNPVYQRPLAQFDLADGIRGLHPVPVNGVQFNLGNDSGLRHSYVDRDVVNGQTYYYALVAYDRGLVTRNADGSFPTTPDGQVDGLSPSITTAVINNDLSGNVTTDINTAQVTPRAPAAGYVAPGRRELHRRRARDGRDRASPSSRRARSRAGAATASQFTNPDPFDTSLTPTYELVDTATGAVLETGTVRPGLNELPLTHGFALTLTRPPPIAVADTAVVFTAGDGGTYVPGRAAGDRRRPSSRRRRYMPFPYDFEVRWAPAGTFPQTSLRARLRAARGPAAVRGLEHDAEPPAGGAARRGQPGPAQPARGTPATSSSSSTASRRARRRCRPAARGAPAGPSACSRPTPASTPRAPAPGAVLSFGPTKPFATGDYVDFSFTAPPFDAAAAREANAATFTSCPTRTSRRASSSRPTRTSSAAASGGSCS